MDYMTKWQHTKAMELLKSAYPIGTVWVMHAPVPLKMPIVDLVKVTGYDDEYARVVVINQEGRNYWLSQFDFRHQTDEPFILLSGTNL